MNRYVITTGTVTYAIKGKDILRKKGFKASVERIMSEKGGNGCGYAIIVEGDLGEAESILRKSGIKILEIGKEND